MTKELTAFINQLNSFLAETGMSKNALAHCSGVSQAQISEWSHGKGVYFTPKAKQVQTFIENYRNNEKRIPESIAEAIRPMLNGDRKRVSEIVSVLQSLYNVYNIT